MELEAVDSKSLRFIRLRTSEHPSRHFCRASVSKQKRWAQKELAVGEAGAEEFGEDGAGGDDVGEGVKREVDAEDFLGDEAIEGADGKVDDAGNAMQREFQGDGAGGGKRQMRAAHEVVIFRGGGEKRGDVDAAEIGFKIGVGDRDGELQGGIESREVAWQRGAEWENCARFLSCGCREKGRGVCRRRLEWG